MNPFSPRVSELREPQEGGHNVPTTENRLFFGFLQHKTYEGILGTQEQTPIGPIGQHWSYNGLHRVL